VADLGRTLVSTVRAKLAAGVAVVAVVAGAGVAFAAWTANGSGSGTARALSARSLTVSASSGDADLFPGGPAGAVYFSVANPNPYSVRFTSATVGTISSSSPADCPGTLVSATSATVSLDVAANSPATTMSIPGLIAMSPTAGDGCQGVSFTVPVTLSGSQR
jgi:hypothetical protein